MKCKNNHQVMIDFREIANSTNLYNFHTHTQFCDGRSSMAEQAEAAYSAGIKHLGFSPHSPISIESPCNMSADDVPAYLSEIQRLKQEYSGRMEIYAGMESDWLGSESAVMPLADLDYTIGSVHFIPNQDGILVDVDGNFNSFSRKMQQYFRDDIEYVVRRFYAASAKMLAWGQFDILGHFDKIAQNASYFRAGIESEAWYDKLVNEYIDQIIASGKVVEINTKARLEHKRFFPHQRHWKRLLQAGVPLIVNSDSHYADRITASRDEALNLLNSLI